MLIRKFFGWQEATADDYRNCYSQYGGNFPTHPDVLSYIHKKVECNEKYYVHTTAGKIDGSICVWKNKYLANDVTSERLVKDLGVPVAKDELILPITKERKIFLPFKSKIVSSLNDNIINRSEFFNSKRSVCLAKSLDAFSKKTVQTRNRELKKFIKEGGEIKDSTEFSASDIVDIYADLFEKRRGRQITNKEKTVEFLNQFRKGLFGKVLFLNGNPCAYQFITRAESLNSILLDFINIGIDTSIQEHSLGTILMWANINEAFSIGGAEKKSIRFSFGRPSADYKSRWCYQEKVGKLL